MSAPTIYAGQRTDTASVPILPGSPWDLNRRNENRVRRRLMSGTWLDEVLARIAEHFDPVRQQVLGRPTLARNLARTVTRQLAVLYDQAPQARHEDGDDRVKGWLDEMARAGLWTMAPRHQQRTILVREGLRGFDLAGPPEARRIVLCSPPADLIYAEAGDDPGAPALLVEARRAPRGVRSEWVWHIWDVRDAATPTYSVRRPKSAKDGDEALRADDLTEEVLGGRFVGPAYPFRYADGQPFIPRVLYHAERTGSLWDPWEGQEIVDGAFDVAMLWTFWLHCVKDASWPQRWVINAILRGSSTEGSEGFERFRAVPADPGAILQFYEREGMGAHIGQWLPGADPNALEMAIASFERATAIQFDLAPADFEQTGSPQSGYAIAIKRSAAREAQRRMEPQFRAGDVALLGMLAAASNRLHGTGLPEEGWSITYPALPWSADERATGVERIKAAKEAEVPVSALWKIQQLEGVGRDEAIELYRGWLRDGQEEADLREDIAPAPEMLSPHERAIIEQVRRGAATGGAAGMTPTPPNGHGG